MKKYLSLFIVLLMAFVVNTNTTKAENRTFSVETGIKTQTDLVVSENENDGINNDEQDKNDDSNDQNDNENKNVQTRRDEFRQKMAGFRIKIGGEKDRIKAKIEELRISGRENVLVRFDKAVERISNLKDRVTAKITDLEAKGVNVASAKASVAITDTKLTEAKGKIAEIHALLVVSINELTVDQKTKLRTLAKDTQTLIIEAHRALKDAVKSLKAEVKVRIEAENNTSETENNNNQ